MSFEKSNFCIRNLIGIKTEPAVKPGSRLKRSIALSTISFFETIKYFRVEFKESAKHNLKLSALFSFHSQNRIITESPAVTLTTVNIEPGSATIKVESVMMPVIVH